MRGGYFERGGKMKKARGSRGIAAVRMRQEGKKKAQWWWLVLMGCAFVWVGESSDVFAMSFTEKCGEPGTCIVLVRIIGSESYCRKPPQGGASGYGYYSISAYDYSCEYPQFTMVGQVSNCLYPTAFYLVHYTKWHWNGRSWTNAWNAASYYTVGDSGHTPLPPVPGEIVSHNYVDIPKLYPNGCSELPSQQPDQTPNLDPGKPDCPQTPLN